jgi:integrase
MINLNGLESVVAQLRDQRTTLVHQLRHVDAALSSLGKACLSARVRTIVTIALHTGMRLGEILSLRHCDLDLTSGLILIPDSKNGEPRHIPMDATVTSLLTAYPRHPRSELVFANKAGGKLSAIRNSFKNACARADITDLHFHDLRHTFASHWMMAAGDLYVLKDILGHKSIVMTQRYAHLSPEFKRAAVNRMDNIWNNAAKPPTSVAEVPPNNVRSLSGHQHASLPPTVSGD